MQKKIFSLARKKRAVKPPYPIYELEHDLHEIGDTHWTKFGDRRVLELFQQMVRRVPAYRKFLADHGCDPSDIKDVEHLHKLPPLDKDNYLRKYPRQELCWDGEFDKNSWVISATSGSTGEPYYFPRQSHQDQQYALTAELYLRSNFKIHERSTLYINAFAMGVWIGGVFTYEAIKTVAEKGEYALSIITPGINKAEVIKAVKNLGKDFDQVIIGSYPPILKDILDDGIRSGLDWKDYNLGIIFSAEGFSESFRDYVIETACLNNPYTTTLNHYGTVDLGTMSHETPLCILIRRLALANPELYTCVFGDIARLPTLTQFMPEMFYFEEDNGRLYCSSYSGLPLLRYDLKDNGGVIGFESMKAHFAECGIDLVTEAKNVGIHDTIWNLPFVYVYERSDFAVTYLGFQVYPEPIRKALQTDEFRDKLTGKFTLLVEYDSNQDQQMFIHLELKSGVKTSKALEDRARAAIVQALMKDNPIYKMNHDTLKEKVYPQVVCWPYEDNTYFAVGGKQKWVKK